MWVEIFFLVLNNLKLFVVLNAKTLKNSGVKIVSIGVNNNQSQIQVLKTQLESISDQVLFSQDYLDGLHKSLYAELAKTICMEAS